MRTSIRSFTALLLVMMASLFVVSQNALARWRFGAGEMTTVERTCRNGMIYATLYNYIPVNWDTAPGGEEWTEDGRDAEAFHDNEWIDIEDEITASRGPYDDDGVDGIRTRANYNILRWDILLDPNDQVKLEFATHITSTVHVEASVSPEHAVVEDCMIEDEFPAPALYEYCSNVTLDSWGYLSNGDFEERSDYWTEFSSNGYPLIYHVDDLPSPIQPDPYSFWVAWLGGANNEISYLEKNVTIPAAPTTLNYWHWIASDDLCGNDFASVRVDGTVIASYDLCNDSGGWEEKSIDLSNYAGQNITFQIRTEGNSSLVSSLFVDNVELQFEEVSASPVLAFAADIEIMDVDFLMDFVQHDSVDPISASLSAPDGTTTQLFNNLAEESPGWENCKYLNLGGDDHGFILDDEGDTEVSNFEGPFNWYIPAEPLSSFDGTPSAGQWDLTLTNSQGNFPDLTLECACMYVTGYRTVRFASENGDISEGAGTVSINVELSEPSAKDTTVHYTTYPAPGSNQQTQSGTVTVAAGQTSASFEVSIVDDPDVEPDEDVQITLSQPGNQYGLGTPTEFDLTILDDDDTMISIADTAVNEGDTSGTPASFAVTLSASSPHAVTVDYQTSDGTATAGTDYMAAAGTVIFAPGSLTQAISVDVLGDELDEADETFFVTLSNPVNGALSDSEATGTIVDDEGAHLFIYLPYLAEP